MKVRVVGVAGGVVLAAGLIYASWFAGTLFGHRLAETQREDEYEANRKVLNEDFLEFRIGTEFPDFTLVDIADSSVSSVYEQLRAGGLLVYFIPGCPSCAEEIQSIIEAAKSVAGEERVLLVSSANVTSLRQWKEGSGISLPVYMDATQFIKSQYEYLIMPSLAFLDQSMTVVDNSTGGWDTDDYHKLLRSAVIE